MSDIEHLVERFTNTPNITDRGKFVAILQALDILVDQLAEITTCLENIDYQLDTRTRF